MSEKYKKSLNQFKDLKMHECIENTNRQSADNNRLSGVQFDSVTVPDICAKVEEDPSYSLELQIFT